MNEGSASEQLRQLGLAKAKDPFDIAPDEKLVYNPTTQDGVLDPILDERAAVTLDKDVLVHPPAVRATELLIHKPLGRFPHRDFRAPTKRDAMKAELIID